MRVSIIVPVYNVEPYIEDCLRSVASQTYKGQLECIIIDDCTPDGSCDVIEKFIKEYIGNIQFKLLHHDKNRGLSAARNTGIDAATGEYIYFLDSDDEITPRCIELLTAPLKRRKYDFIIGDYSVIGSNKDNYPPLLVKEKEMLKNYSIRESYLSYKWYVMAVNKLCNTEFVRNEKLYFKEGIIHEDDLWSFQLACLAQTMYVIRNQTYIYKVRRDSITNNSPTDMRVISISLITEESKKWATEKGILYDKNIFRKILSFREIALAEILSTNSRKRRKVLYLKCYKRIRIPVWGAYWHKAIRHKSIIKELYNYLPGCLGLCYINLYNAILKKNKKINILP